MRLTARVSRHYPPTFQQTAAFKLAVADPSPHRMVTRVSEDVHSPSVFSPRQLYVLFQTLAQEGCLQCRKLLTSGTRIGTPTILRTLAFCALNSVRPALLFHVATCVS